MTFMKNKGVIFDFNGTLFIDSDKHEQAWRIFAQEQFDRTISDEEFRTKIHGWNTEFIMNFLSGKVLSKQQIDEFAERKETMYRRLCQEDAAHFHLTEGAEQLLDEIKSLNLPRTIATASRKMNVDFYVDCFHLGKWFNVEKIVYDDGSLLGKPNPDIYLKAVSVIGMNPKDCIVFEDALSGIESAFAAGIGTIVAISPQEQKIHLKCRQEIDCIIGNFNEFDRALMKR